MPPPRPIALPCRGQGTAACSPPLPTKWEAWHSGVNRTNTHAHITTRGGAGALGGAAAPQLQLRAAAANELRTRPRAHTARRSVLHAPSRDPISSVGCATPVAACTISASWSSSHAPCVSSGASHRAAREAGTGRPDEHERGREKARPQCSQPRVHAADTTRKHTRAHAVATHSRRRTFSLQFTRAVAVWATLDAHGYRLAWKWVDVCARWPPCAASTRWATATTPSPQQQTAASSRRCHAIVGG